MYTLGVSCLNVNSLLKGSSESCGFSDDRLCRFINNQNSIYCLTDTRIDCVRKETLNQILSKGHSFGNENTIERVFTTINKESISHKHHFAGVTTIFPEKLDPAFEYMKWYPHKLPTPRYGIALAKLSYGPTVIIANVYGRTSGREDSKASLFNKLN